MSHGLDGRFALVTGAGRGIGAAVATALVEEGARVLATDLDPAGVRSLAARYPGRLTAQALDVTDAAAVESLFDTAERRPGRWTSSSTWPGSCAVRRSWS